MAATRTYRRKPGRPRKVRAPAAVTDVAVGPIETPAVMPEEPVREVCRFCGRSWFCEGSIEKHMQVRHGATLD